MYKQKFISNLNNKKWKEEFQDGEDINIELPPSDEEIQVQDQNLEEKNEIEQSEEEVVEEEENIKENKKIEWLDEDIEGIDEIDDNEEEIDNINDDIDHDKQTVFVSNLPLRVSDQEIHAFFSQFGTILKLDVPRNEGSQFTKGRAFIEFTSPHEAQEIACQKLEIKGKELQMRVGIQQIKTEVVKQKSESSDEIRSRSRSQSK